MKAKWLGIMVVLSVTAIIDGGWLASWLALEPRMVWRGEVWRLVTWALVETRPMTLIVACMAIHGLGGPLEEHWGAARLRGSMLAIAAIAGVVVCLLSLVTGDASAWHMCGMSVAYALAIAYAQAFPERQLEFWGVLRLRGRQLVLVVIAFAVTLAMYSGFRAMAPELVACAVAVMLPGQRGRSST